MILNTYAVVDTNKRTVYMQAKDVGDVLATLRQYANPPKIDKIFKEVKTYELICIMSDYK